MNREQLLQLFTETRQKSIDLSARLKAEDFRIQSMADVSPPWWNLGHTSWFFAKNVLEPYGLGSEEDARLEYVLNSYYVALGPRLPRAERGRVTRPTTSEILDFRASVNARMMRLIAENPDCEHRALDFLVQLGVHHEQQHQELMVTEIKHILGSNAPHLREAYVSDVPDGRGQAPLAASIRVGEGLYEFGNREGGWGFDNELPVHRAFLHDYALMNRLVTNGEYLEFIEDGGYGNPLLWLSNGWDALSQQGWDAPLYWERVDGRWTIWTLAGSRELDLNEPVCHVSHYEADAFASWKARNFAEWRGGRLPTEREWEEAARRTGFPQPAANLLETGAFHPRVAPERTAAELLQTAGDVWEWTSSHYEPYPGFEPFDGNLFEYNGKFMDNQRVLRGGSCATPASHLRVSYRNFWKADTRFQFSGFRLAKSL